jgi:thiol-disulfide isomerase/thioredoxin
MRTKTLIALFLAATVGVIVLLFVQTSGTGKKTSISLGAPPKAAAACTSGADCLPKVQFVDTNGKTYTPSQLAGKVVFVNFWATWCGPCQKEIPAFSEIYNRYKDKDVIFLGVMTDNPDAQTLLNFASDYNMSYPVVRSNQDLMLAFGYPDALPTTFVYDRTGKQFTRHVGPLSEATLTGILKDLL